jgi:uncharacterized protein YdiU (UPF0061 family)
MRETMADLLAAEAEAAEQIRDEEDLGPTHASRQAPKEASQVYSVRIPVAKLEQLRQRAAEKGVAPSALMRQWVIERLDADEAAKRRLPHFEALVDALTAVLHAVQPRAWDEALWMVARAEDDQRVLVFQEKVFTEEEAADEEARSRGGVVIPLSVARDYRPDRERA